MSGWPRTWVEAILILLHRAVAVCPRVAVERRPSSACRLASLTPAKAGDPSASSVFRAHLVERGWLERSFIGEEIVFALSSAGLTALELGEALEAVN